MVLKISSKVTQAKGDAWISFYLFFHCRWCCCCSVCHDDDNNNNNNNNNNKNNVNNNNTHMSHVIEIALWKSTVPSNLLTIISSIHFYKNVKSKCLIVLTFEGMKRLCTKKTNISIKHKKHGSESNKNNKTVR